MTPIPHEQKQKVIEATRGILGFKTREIFCCEKVGWGDDPEKRDYRVPLGTVLILVAAPLWRYLQFLRVRNKIARAARHVIPDDRLLIVRFTTHVKKS